MANCYLARRLCRNAYGKTDALTMTRYRPQDRAWDEGKLDVSVMAKYLEELLKGQLTEK